MPEPTRGGDRRTGRGVESEGREGGSRAMGHEEIWTRNAWVVPAGLAWPGGAVTDTVTTNWPPCATASGPRVRLVDRPGVREMVRLVEEGEAEAAVEVEVEVEEPRAGDVVVVVGRRGSWGELDAHGDHDPVLVHAPAIGNRHLSRELLGRGQDGGRRNGGPRRGVLAVVAHRSRRSHRWWRQAHRRDQQLVDGKKC